MTGPAEMYGIAGIALTIIGILTLFVRSMVKNQRVIVQATLERQDEMFKWFTNKMNGSLDALKASIDSQRHATEHNTKNLKTVQELSTTVFTSMMDRLTQQESSNSEIVINKLDELLVRDRSQTRVDDGTESTHAQHP